VRQLQQIPMQPLFGFRQLSLLHQCSNSGQFSALGLWLSSASKKMPKPALRTPEFSSNRGRAAFSRQQNCSTKSSR